MMPTSTFLGQGPASLRQGPASLRCLAGCLLHCLTSPEAWAARRAWILAGAPFWHLSLPAV